MSEAAVIDPNARAAQAEQAVLRRHLRRLWAMPGTRLGAVGAPATGRERLFRKWDYWWQAHLVDALVDAQLRAPDRRRERLIARVVRGIWFRNRFHWTNDYFDDMSWLGLALQRAELATDLDYQRPIKILTDTVAAAWHPQVGGGIQWRIGDDFYNAPANGPAGIMLLRDGRRERAAEIADWVYERLLDPDTGLIFDGVHLRRSGDELERNIFTYCQGVILGLCTELAVATGEARHGERAQALVTAIERHLSTDGVLAGAGDGDRGLFAGILARNLAWTAQVLPGEDAKATRATARRLVLSSADAAWRNRVVQDDMPVFGPDWSVPATAESGRDLSVQLGGWLVLEAAATLQ